MQAEQVKKQAIIVKREASLNEAKAPQVLSHIMERTSTLSIDDKFPDISSLTTPPSILISSHKATTPSDYRHRKDDSIHRINKKT